MAGGIQAFFGDGWADALDSLKSRRAALGGVMLSGLRQVRPLEALAFALVLAGRVVTTVTYFGSTDQRAWHIALGLCCAARLAAGVAGALISRSAAWARDHGLPGVLRLRRSSPSSASSASGWPEPGRPPYRPRPAAQFDLEAMSRKQIVIYGYAGSGKTTLARRLAHELGLRPSSCDSLYHGPGSTPTPPEEFRARSRRTRRQPAGWVADGN